MNKRQLAIQELYEGLMAKYGTSANSRNIILSEIEKFSQYKSKISVEDIDKLEDDIKRLCGLPKKIKHEKKSPLYSNDRKIEEKTPETEKRLIPGFSGAPTSNFPYIFPCKASGKKIVERNQDHILFPNESSPYNLSFDSAFESKDGFSYKFKNNYDD